MVYVLELFQSYIYIGDRILDSSGIFDKSSSNTPPTPYILDTIHSVGKKELYIWYEILDCEVKQN
jgi:hypothetical protein